MTGITDEQAAEIAGTIEAGNAHRMDPCHYVTHAHPPKYGHVSDIMDLDYRPRWNTETVELHTIRVTMPQQRERTYYAGKCSCGVVFYWQAED